MTPELIDEMMSAACEGCCRNAEWRGRTCTYHSGYEAGLVAMIEHRRDIHSHICPGCRSDLGVVGLTSLAYTFEVASKNELREQVWHRSCLRAVSVDPT